MRESYVRPAVSASESGPTWLPVWRFRLAALLILALVGYGAVKTAQYLQGSTRQDPGLTDQQPAPEPS